MFSATAASDTIALESPSQAEGCLPAEPTEAMVQRSLPRIRWEVLVLRLVWFRAGPPEQGLHGEQLMMVDMAEDQREELAETLPRPRCSDEAFSEAF